jgi:aerobic carbon-monoxide dehydrogenase large subunit
VPVPARSGAASAMPRPALARDRVRFAGEPVAIVVGEDRYVAEDAAENIVVDIDPLEAVLDPTEAAASSVRLFDGHSNVAATKEYGAPVDDVMDAAPVVVAMAIRNQRLAPTSIEARAVIVEPSDAGLTVWVSHQAPHRLKRELAAALDLDPDAVRVVCPRVGGAFGAKSQTFPEYIAVAYLARQLGRPVRWIEDRREALIGATHGRGQNQRLRLAADEQGSIMAVEALIDADIGAYPHTGEFVPSVTGWLLSGPYKIPRLYARIQAVVTNQTPAAPYRGAGRPEAAFALERIVDRLARRLELDPAEVRFRNFIGPDEFPYRSPTGAVYDSGRYADALRQALDLSGYDDVRAEQARTADGLVGVGIGSYIERSGGQSGTSEFGAVEVEPDGDIVARSGTAALGQANTTALGQLVASVLDVGLDRVRVVQGDTDAVAKGTGTFGSRSIQVGGAALAEAASRLRDEALTRAAKKLEVAEIELEYEDGVFVAPDGRDLSLVELIDDEPLSFAAEVSPPQAFPFGSYVAVVEIDRDTGVVHIRQMTVVDDCGVAVNPAGVRAQTLGSMVQGIGQALYEGVVYDELGQPLASSLMDYSLPTAAEAPPVRMGEQETPNPNVPFGAKGAGEAGCIGAPPAVVNAIADALGSDEGLDMPVTPEVVWRALSRRALRS